MIFVGELFLEYKGIVTIALLVGTLLGFGVMLYALCIKPETKGGLDMSNEEGRKTSPATIIENSGGGIGGDITVDGTGARGPVVGLDTNGLRVTQTGPGTGLRVSVTSDGSAPVTGIRSVVSSGKAD